MKRSRSKLANSGSKPIRFGPGLGAVPSNAGVEWLTTVGHKKRIITPLMSATPSRILHQERMESYFTPVKKHTLKDDLKNAKINLNMNSGDEKMKTSVSSSVNKLLDSQPNNDTCTLPVEDLQTNSTVKIMSIPKVILHSSLNNYTNINTSQILPPVGQPLANNTVYHQMKNNSSNILPLGSRTIKRTLQISDKCAKSIPNCDNPSDGENPFDFTLRDISYLDDSGSYKVSTNILPPLSENIDDFNLTLNDI